MDDARSFDFDTGWLCLDYVNTLGDRPDVAPHEEDLHAYDDLVAWGEAAEILSGAEADALRQRATRNPIDAREAFARAIALREAMYRVFSAVAGGAEPPANDLAAIERAVAAAMPRAHLARHDAHFHWRFAPDTDDCLTMLGPVAWSATELLTGDLVPRLRECAGPDCSWLFLDRSKNGSRRWCDMRACGNRAKARRHRARQTAA